MLSSKDIANIILHIIIIATFIIIFFFTYGAYLEQQVIKQQTAYIVDDLVGDLKVIAPEITPLLKMHLDKIDKPSMEEADKKALDHNNILRRNSLLVLAVVVTIGLGAVYYITKSYDISIKELLISNGVSLVAVGLTYYLFSTFFIAHYRSMDPNFVKKTLFESLNMEKNH